MVLRMWKLGLGGGGIGRGQQNIFTSNSQHSLRQTAKAGRGLDTQDINTLSHLQTQRNILKKKHILNVCNSYKVINRLQLLMTDKCMCTGDDRPPLIWSSAVFYDTFTCPFCLTAWLHASGWPTEGQCFFSHPETEATLQLCYSATLTLFLVFQGRNAGNTSSQIKWDIISVKMEKNDSFQSGCSLCLFGIWKFTISCICSLRAKKLKTGNYCDSFTKNRLPFQSFYASILFAVLSPYIHTIFYFSGLIFDLWEGCTKGVLTPHSPSLGRTGYN